MRNTGEVKLFVRVNWTGPPSSRQSPERQTATHVNCMEERCSLFRGRQTCTYRTHCSPY